MKWPSMLRKAFFSGGLVLLVLGGLAGQAFGSKTPKFAYVSNSLGIDAYTVDSTTGALLSLIPGSPFAGAGSSLGAIHPSGKFAYGRNADGILVFTIDGTTGALSPVSGSPFGGAGAFLTVIHPSGEFVYGFSSGGILAFTIDSTTGSLSPVSGSPFGGPGSFVSLIHPSGKFVYGSSSSGILAFTIDSTTGALSPVSGSPFAGLGFLISVERSGKFGYGLDVFNKVSAITIDSTTGALSPVPGSPFSVEPGVDLFTLAVDPTGKFVYTSNAGGTIGSMSAFAIDSVTGALSLVGGSPFAGGSRRHVSRGIVFDASGKFLYVVVSEPDSFVSAFNIDSTTGALGPVPGSPFSPGLFCTATLDPSAKFFYFGLEKIPRVAGLAINSATGALSPVPGSPFSTGGNACSSVAIAPSQGNTPPVADAGPDHAAIAGESVQFDGSNSSDSDGTIASYHWEFGDGESADGVTVGHVYATAGQFTATLTVTDDAGDTGTDTAVVTVESTAQAVQQLSALVDSFNLAQGISTSLDAKLLNALDSLNAASTADAKLLAADAASAASAGNRQDAANKLQAFINAVNAQRGKQLTDAQADALIALARRILAVI